MKVTINPPADPRTSEEWQNAADAAYALLAIDAARQYGLVRGGPTVSVERCGELLERARREGIKPASDAVERYVAAFAR